MVREDKADVELNPDIYSRIVPMKVYKSKGMMDLFYMRIEMQTQCTNCSHCISHT